MTHGIGSAITIGTDNKIYLDNENTGLRVTQRQDGTVVYSAGHGGKNYVEHKMPHVRYSTWLPKTTDKGAASVIQFEADIRALLKTL